MIVAQPILPFALPLVVCDGYEPAEDGKLNLLGSFFAVHPENLPHVHELFFVVAHLTGGRGNLITFVDVRNVQTNELVYWTEPHEVEIPDRAALARLVIGLEDVPFPQSGVYLIELYCENTCIADFRLIVHAAESEE